MGRLRWMGSGAAIATIGIALSSFWPQTDPAVVRELREENQRLEAERKALVEVVERLDIEQRVAEVEVLQQHRNEMGEVVQTVISFTEFDRNGAPTEPKVFGIPGDVPHFDALVVKFDSEFIKQGDPLRGKSLALFRRVYGDVQAPASGYWLDSTGAVPDVYRVAAEPSAFELNVWKNFWEYARNPELARRDGVRVAQGEAVYAPVRQGETWTLTLEGDGGLNLIRTDDDAAPADKAPAPNTLADARLSAPAPISNSKE